ncbi:MAG: WD40/YVTN/BNR-like repeat-containing protein, partial [Candidatus Acidiferrales bacterium]
MSPKPSSKVWFAILASLACALALAFGAPAQTLTKDSLHGMEWRLVGPFRGGRVEAVAGIPGNPYVYYFGAVAGGLWKTTNAGVNWSPIFDKESNPSIGAIAIAPSDPNVIYVGTGEPCFRGDITYGNGVYKSVDAGKTWTHIGLEDSRHIGRILIDPTNPDIVYVAAIGHAFGPNEERGVFRSSDGGKTWQKVLFKDDKTGAVDIEFAGGNPHIIYAAMYQVLRQPWNIISGGPGSGLYKSTDSGSTWHQIKGHGFPDVLLGKIGIATSAADPQRVYALVEAAQDKGGLYVSHDQGDSWQFVNGDHRLIQRAFYYIHVFADPSDADRIYVQDVGSYRSINAGKDWEQIRVPHGDNHALWIDPKDPKRLIAGNDGGATISVDGGATWTAQDNQPTAQFY